MGNFDNADVSGEIEFALRYSFETRSLEVCIKACRNLAFGEEKKKKCNPYVKTYLLPDSSSQGKRKTRVQRNTVDPAFQDTLKYQVEPAQLATRRLQVSVWHLGTLSRRVFLGEVIVPLATWDFEDGRTRAFCWYPLRAKVGPVSGCVTPNPTSSADVPLRRAVAETPAGEPRAPEAEKSEEGLSPARKGELAVRAKLVIPEGPGKPQEAQQEPPPANGQLCLVVLGARNLPVRPDGTLNSFVKGLYWSVIQSVARIIPLAVRTPRLCVASSSSCLTLPDQQKLRRKSPVLKRQGSPQWKHSFVFSGLSAAQLHQASLELTVWDQAVFGLGDRLLGGAKLGAKDDAAGSADAHAQEELQWRRVLSSPNLWTDMTLVLH
ncbi:Synaptotagmin-like protein 3 [Galemys pyrenaicus]|uniref:Synaptotagmin-like protein 3 n=1 Tax=Galemys pyrenaicus TaxID=202257 RepID=A0A8J6AK13_GALPY|nr:Synaptotagmin-like protein 3 [Galemys pyrenaicus]